jgi:hypothetical protein
MKDRGLSFPLLLKGDPLRVTYGITRTPWLVVTDRDNRIVYTRPPNPPTPIDVAKAVRAKLNEMLGDRAVPLPTSYPPPYDLHLKTEKDLVDRTAPVAIAETEWLPWVEKYLGGVGDDEVVAEFPARGAVADGKAALQLAREVWTARYGAEEVRAQAPYRSYRKDQRWIVMGSGLDRTLGTGLIAVIDAGSGRIIRITKGNERFGSSPIPPPGGKPVR